MLTLKSNYESLNRISILNEDTNLKKKKENEILSLISSPPPESWHSIMGHLLKNFKFGPVKRVQAN